MANISLARKKELNEPDEFIAQSNRALTYARQNKGTITGIIVAALFLVIMAAGFQYYSQTRETKAFALYASDMDWYETAKTNNEKAPSLKEIRERGDSFIAAYSGTAAAMLARAKYAGIYFEEKDYSAAAKLYEALLSDVDHDTALKNITLCALAQCYEAMNDNEQAVARYQAILSGDNEIKKDEALFHLARIYAANGEKEKSLAAYARIADEFNDSMYVDMAREKING